MPEPLTVSISHRLGRDRAKQRLERGLGQIRTQLAPFTEGLDYRWDGYRLNFNVAAMRQTVTGVIEVFEDSVRIEIHLPMLLRFFGRKIIGRVRNEAHALLQKPTVPS